MEPERISAPDVRRKVMKKSALLVCAYDDDNKFRDFHLGGAISLNEFKSTIDGMEKSQEIFFYCAWPNEGSAAGLAAQYQDLGFTSAKVLGGGVDAWKKAGFPL